ncbi:MAG: hypothetical protein AAGH71_01455 [Planctomycetota bacterium]
MKSQQNSMSKQQGLEAELSAARFGSFVEALFQIAERIERQDQRLRQSLALAARDGNLVLVQQILEEWDDLAEDG